MIASEFGAADTPSIGEDLIYSSLVVDCHKPSLFNRINYHTHVFRGEGGREGWADVVILRDRYSRTGSSRRLPNDGTTAKKLSYEPHDDRRGAQPASSPPPSHPPSCSLQQRDPGIPRHAGEGGVRTLRNDERRQGERCGGKRASLVTSRQRHFVQ